MPLPWTIRAASSTGKVGARAASSVPAQKTPIAVPKACRVVTRWRNQPVTGMTTAMVSMKAVESHCAVVSETSNSVFRLGRALNITVSLRITMKVAATNQRSTP